VARLGGWLDWVAKTLILPTDSRPHEHIPDTARLLLGQVKLTSRTAKNRSAAADCMANDHRPKGCPLPMCGEYRYVYEAAQGAVK